MLTTDKQAMPDNPTVVFAQNSASEIARMLTDKGHTEAVIIGGTMTIGEFVVAGLVTDICFVVEPFSSESTIAFNIREHTRSKNTTALVSTKIGES